MHPSFYCPPLNLLNGLLVLLSEIGSALAFLLPFCPTLLAAIVQLEYYIRYISRLSAATLPTVQYVLYECKYGVWSKDLFLSTLLLFDELLT